MSALRRSTRRNKANSGIAFPQVKTKSTEKVSTKAATNSKGVGSQGKTIRIGNNNVKKGRNLLKLDDSSDLLKKEDYTGLRKKLDEDGILFLRQVIPKETALAARECIIDHVTPKGALDESSEEKISQAKMKTKNNYFKDGWTVDAQTGGVVGGKDDDVEGWSAVGNDQRLVDVYDGPYLKRLLENLFDDVETQPHNTWIRLKGKGDVTIEHADYYYFKRNTSMLSNPVDENVKGSNKSELCKVCNKDGSIEEALRCTLCHVLVHKDCVETEALIDISNCFHCQSCADSEIPYYTCWLSLSDVGIENSTLGFITGTQKLSGFDRPKPGLQVCSSIKAFSLLDTL